MTRRVAFAAVYVTIEFAALVAYAKCPDRACFDMVETVSKVVDHLNPEPIQTPPPPHVGQYLAVSSGSTAR
jgi:hypothetical protein